MMPCMDGAHLRILTFGLLYFAAAAIPIAFTRLEGGVAFLWIATALLIARLRTIDRAEWPKTIGAAGVASMLATGLFGVGWAAAPALVVLNVLDALVAVWILAAVEARRSAVSVENDVPAIVAACLAGAVATMAPAGFVTGLATGTPLLGNAANWVIGHALGSLTFGPFMFLCMRGKMGPWLGRVVRGKDLHALVAILLLVTTSVIAFSNADMPALFLPVLALVALVYRAGLEGAAFGSITLATIGVSVTLLGLSGIQLGASEITFQYLQFFLGLTTLTLLPISAVVSAREEMAERMRESEEGYRLLADNIEDIVLRLDLQGRVTYVSPSVRNVTRQDPGDLIGTSPLQFVDRRHRPAVRSAYNKTLAALGSPVSFEFVAVTADDQPRWFEMQGRCLLDSQGVPASLVGAVRETTGRKLLEAALGSAAETDQLTGLLIRRAFLDAARTIASSGTACHLAIFDLDHLDAVNLMFGNQVGDLALATFANVARRTVRSSDLLGRLEGDTFGLVLPHTSREQAETICRKILTSYAGERPRHQGQSISLSASAGLAPLQIDLENALRAARSGLTLAKAEGRAHLRLVA